MLSFYHYFLYKLNYLYRALLLTALLIPAFLFIKDNRKYLRIRIGTIVKQCWVIFFFYYLSIILTATIFARKVQNPYQSIIGHFGFGNNVEWNLEIILNILMFVPLTVLYLQAFKPNRPWEAALKLTIFTSVFIELSQLIFWLGEFQLSDLLYNTIGGVIGIALWMLLRSLL